MKTSIKHLLAGLSGTLTYLFVASHSHCCGQQAPIVEFLFNGADAHVHNSGTSGQHGVYHNLSDPSKLAGDPGTGVSGMMTDRAFQNVPDPEWLDIGALEVPQIADLDALQSVTIQGWFLLTEDDVPNEGPALFDAMNGAHYGFRLYGPSPAGALTLTWGADGQELTFESEPSYWSVNEWVYFAVSFSVVSGNEPTYGSARFYRGSRSNRVAFVNRVDLQTELIRYPNTTDDIYIGGSPSWQHFLVGRLDNIRVFGSRTDSTQIPSISMLEGIRLIDLAQPIPVSECPITLEVEDQGGVVFWPDLLQGFGSSYGLETRGALGVQQPWASVEGETIENGYGWKSIVFPLDGHQAYFRLSTW